MLAADIALLLIMLVGLFRMRRYSGDTVGLVEHLWRQVCLSLVVVHATHRYTLEGGDLALACYRC